MKINTKFKVGDLVKFKFDNLLGEMAWALLVMEIDANVCYGGTQVFYKCRIISVHTEKRYEGMQQKEIMVVGHVHVQSTNTNTGWRTYREDELIELDAATKEKIYV